MLGFGKKKEDYSSLDEFNFIVKGDDIKLILDLKNLDKKNLKNIPCLIFSSDKELFSLVGGSSSYKMGSGYGNAYLKVRDNIFSLNNFRIKTLSSKVVTFGNEFNEKDFDLIGFGLSYNNLSDLLKKNIRNGVLSISFEDVKAHYSINVYLNVDLNIFFEQVFENFVDVSFNGEIEYKLDETKSRTNETKGSKFLNITFKPGITLFSPTESFKAEFFLNGEKCSKKLNFHNIFNGLKDFLDSSDFNSDSNGRFSLSASRGNKFDDIFDFVKNVGKELYLSVDIEINGHKISKKILLDVADFKKQILRYKNYKNFEDSDLVLVHAFKKEFMGKFFSNDILGRRFLFGSPIRDTVHFTLNHVVAGHMYGNWDDADAVLIMPFDKALELNKENVYGGTTVDFFFVGYAHLPKETEFIYKNIGESWDDFCIRVNNKISFMGCRIMVGGMWAWSDSWDVSDWWKGFCEKRSLAIGAHTNLPFSHVEDGAIYYVNTQFELPLMDQYKVKYGKKFIDIYKKEQPEEYKNFLQNNIRYRQYQIEFLKRDYSPLFNRYKKFLIAWKKYWDKKGDVNLI